MDTILPPSMRIIPPGGDWIDGLLRRPLRDHEKYIRGVLRCLVPLVEGDAMPAFCKRVRSIADDETSPDRAQNALFYILVMFHALPALVDVFGDALHAGHSTFLRDKLPKMFLDLGCGETSPSTYGSAMPQCQSVWVANMVEALRSLSEYEVLSPDMKRQAQLDAERGIVTSLRDSVDMGDGLLCADGAVATSRAGTHTGTDPRTTTRLHSFA